MPSIILLPVANRIAAKSVDTTYTLQQTQSFTSPVHPLLSGSTQSISWLKRALEFQPSN